MIILAVMPVPIAPGKIVCTIAFVQLFSFQDGKWDNVVLLGSESWQRWTWIDPANSQILQVCFLNTVWNCFAWLYTFNLWRRGHPNNTKGGDTDGSRASSVASGASRASSAYFLHIGDVADFHRFQIDLKFDFVVQGHQRQHHFTQTASSRQQRLKQKVKTKFALHHSKNNRWLSTVAG